MRAKVASRMNTHALDATLLKLNPLQLSLLFGQAIKEEKEEKKEKMELVKFWNENLQNVVKALQIFIDPKLYKHMKDMEEIEVLREDISEDNFADVWDQMMDVIPQIYEVEEYQADHSDLLIDEDDELSEMIAGWVSLSEKANSIKEGE